MADRKTSARKKITPNTPVILGKLKDNKNPVKMRQVVNKRLTPTYDLEAYIKIYFKKLLPPLDVSLISRNQFIQ